jgi:hypothetical protein
MLRSPDFPSTPTIPAPCRKKYLRLNQELSDTLAGTSMPDLAIPRSPNHFGNPLFAESCNGGSKDREEAAVDDGRHPYSGAGAVDGTAASGSLGPVISLPCSVATRSMEVHHSSCEVSGGCCWGWDMLGTGGKVWLLRMLRTAETHHRRLVVQDQIVHLASVQKLPATTVCLDKLTCKLCIRLWAFLHHCLRKISNRGSTVSCSTLKMSIVGTRRRRASHTCEIRPQNGVRYRLAGLLPHAGQGELCEQSLEPHL